MQNRPTAAELLDAVAGWMEDELMPALDGRLRYHTRVAANVLRILEREWLHEEDAVHAEWERLEGLLGPHPDGRPDRFGELRDLVRERNRELCERIRGGELDDRWGETLEAVHETVADKLRIANPRYADLDR